MGGKYEIRYYTGNPEIKQTMEYWEDGYIEVWKDEYTNSFLKFIKLLITKKVIYFKIMCVK